MSDFARRLRAGEPMVGFWVVLDTPGGIEKLATLGLDYLCLDAQHGLLSPQAVRTGLLAVDAGSAVGQRPTAGIVRVASNSLEHIGRALDDGAAAVIVPLVNNADQAAAAVAAANYPPAGERSYGPSRAPLRLGATPAEANDNTAVMVMIETRDGLANVADIAQTPGLDGLYIGPSDLSLALGASRPRDPAFADEFEAALLKIRTAARAAGIACGIHTHAGAEARRRLAEGFTFASISSDLTFLAAAAASELDDARG